MVIYFNPDCSKCNEALDLLHSAHCDVEIRDYLKQPPDVEELRRLVEKLGCPVSAIMRTTEPFYQKNFSGVTFTDEEWLLALSQNPVLIQRPIVINGDRAIIGRPPVEVLKLARQ